MMKTQKKVLVLLLVFALALTLVACGGSSVNLVGTWSLTGGNFFDDGSVERDSGSIIFEFKEDGSLVRTINGNDTLKGTWEVSGDKVTMTINRDTLSANFKIRGKTLTLTIVDMGPKDGETIVFTKK